VVLNQGAKVRIFSNKTMLNVIFCEKKNL